MARLRYNQLSGTLGASLTSSGTTITFAAALTYDGGTSVPTISSPDYIPLNIDAGSSSYEVVYLTAYTSGATTGTISRGQEGRGGTGVSHSNGAAFLCGPSAFDVANAEFVNAVSASSTAQTIPDPWATATGDSLNDITLTANCTFTFPSAAAGKSFTIILRQDGTGSRTVSWPGSGAIVWMSGGGAPVLSTAANAVDIATFICTDGAHWLGAFTPGYSPTLGGDDEWVGSIDAYTTAPSATVGTWVSTVWATASLPNAGYGRQNTSGAQNDAVAYKMPLSAGTYTITLAVRESTNTGIATVEVDGTSVGTLDTYNATSGTGAALSVAGVSIATSTVHEIRLVMASKNSSSSGYFLGLIRLTVGRTS